MPFAFNINLLIGSAPRTLPIRFSMTTTMLLFVIASLPRQVSTTTLIETRAQAGGSDSARLLVYRGSGSTQPAGPCPASRPLFTPIGLTAKTYQCCAKRR